MFILVFAVFLTFIVLNLSNTCNISFGFIILEDIPVFLSSLVSFMLGILFAVPLAFSLNRKKSPLSKISNKPGKGVIESSTDSSIDHSRVSDIKKEDSPYGID